MEKAQNIWIEFKDKIFKKKEEKITTAMDELELAMKYINFCGYNSGLEFIDGYKRNWRFVFACSVNLTAIIIGIYTFYHIWPSTDNIVMIGGYAFNVLIWVKLFFVLSNHPKYMSLVHYIYKVYKSNLSGPRERILMKVTEKVFYHMKINMGGMVAGIVFYSAFPCYDFFINGHMTLVSPLVLPYVDATKWQGYWTLTFFNIFLVGYSLNICLTISNLFFATVDVYDGLVSLLEHDFGTFDKMSETKERDRMYQAPFRNLIVGCTDLARLSSYSNDLYGVISTAQVAMSYLVVVSLLGAFLIFDYVGGIGGALTFYIEMILFCYMGQLLDNTNERIITVIYNAKWYSYEVRYQKDMITALYIAQNLQPICLANVYPLNFDTGLKLTNNIYSLVMFMLSMFD